MAGGGLAGLLGSAKGWPCQAKKTRKFGAWNLPLRLPFNGPVPEVLGSFELGEFFECLPYRTVRKYDNKYPLQSFGARKWGKTPCDCRTAVCDEHAESRQARRGTNLRRTPKPKEKETWDLEPNPKPKTQQRQPGETAARGSTGRVATGDKCRAAEAGRGFK